MPKLPSPLPWFDKGQTEVVEEAAVVETAADSTAVEVPVAE